jgi:hypothetical protein
MHQVILRYIWIVVIVLVVVSAYVSASNKSTLDHETSYHEQIIELLQTNDLVIPASLPVHPTAVLYNREAIIPPQCYTKTEGKHNPCYVCHQNSLPGRENTMNDGGLQQAYSFSDVGLTNHWQNLFEDRSDRVAKISDKAILQWIAEDNYSELPGRLNRSKFEGWIPDLHNLQLGSKAFDGQGFALDGSHWVAFNYKPMPSTFWPTNGSTDDVMIRLSEIYRTNKNGQYSQDIYQTNLAILEANIKGLDGVSTPGVDEQVVGKDLSGDGKLTKITYIGVVDSWVGAAQGHYLDTYSYPEGTEFLHTVRYIGIDEQGNIGVSQRMKEVRYMRNWQAYNKGSMSRYYQLEQFEKELGYLPGYTRLGHWGLDNGTGWSIQGFIEGRNGRLRSSTYEENFFCMGCHNSIGSTIDKTFSFARKIDGSDGWGYINLRGMPDAPTMGETDGEIATYLERAGGGGEFRSNPEMLSRWFRADGSLNKEKVAKADVYQLITPSRDRALILNKAYRVIVEDQDFIYGRDATVSPPPNVYEQVDSSTSPTLPKALFYTWDIRLDWSIKK